MISNNLKSICVLALFSITACAPLRQAPLVYSSKVNVGLDIVTPSSEQSSLQFNFGYKQTDVAYVPVYVSIPCEGSNTDCTNKIFALKDVTGKNNVGDSKIPETSIDSAKTRIDEFKKLLQEKDVSISSYYSAKREFKEANHFLNITDKELIAKAIADEDVAISDEKQSISNMDDARKAVETADNKYLLAFKKYDEAIKFATNIKTNPATTPAEQQTADDAVSIEKANYDAAKKEKLDAETSFKEKELLAKAATEKANIARSNRITAQNVLSNAQSLKVTAEKKMEEAEKIKNVAIENFNKINTSELLKDLNLIGQADNKSDAFSVFGSFDAHTSTSKNVGDTGVGIAVGKIFSTGVGAQNITQGLRDYYSRMEIDNSKCIAEAEKSITNLKLTADKNNELITMIFQLCQKSKPPQAGLGSGLEK